MLRESKLKKLLKRYLRDLVHINVVINHQRVIQKKEVNL